jgi:hypothetical protein
MSQLEDTSRYRKDHRGAYIPVEQIREIDLARDELVNEKAAKIEATQASIAALKDELMGDIAAFVQLSAERYGAKVGGDKGNITLMSFDGTYKLKRQTSESLGFDEGLRAAKNIIDECLEEWSRNSPVPLRAIVEQAFDVNKEGRINTNAILSLRRIKIDNERWQQAMQAISDSLQTQDSKAYVRLYKRDKTGKYNAVPLDMSAL